MKLICNFFGLRGSIHYRTLKFMTLKLIIGAFVGGVLGFAYYKFVGCSTGSCPLTSNPLISTIYGMAMGALVASNF